MKNDFKKSDFRKVKNTYSDSKYYVTIKGKWIEVSESIYKVYKNSYQKLYRDYIRDRDLLVLYEDVDEIYPYVTDKVAYDAIDMMYKKEMKIKLLNGLKHLSEEELNIISYLYFKEGTERSLASQMNISKTAVHYKKVKILSKIRDFLDQESI